MEETEKMANKLVSNLILYFIPPSSRSLMLNSIIIEKCILNKATESENSEMK